MVQIVRNDFDRILNSAASCALITVEGAMPVLAEQLRTELEALHIGADLDMVIKVSYHPASENRSSFFQLTKTPFRQHIIGI